MDTKRKSPPGRISKFVDKNGGLLELLKGSLPIVAGIATAASSKNGSPVSKTVASIGKLAEMWQRKEGEPLASVSTATKALSVVGAYALYRRLDPNQKVSKTAILGIASYLLGLLLFPKKDATAESAKNFEERVTLGVEKLSPEMKSDVLNWVSALIPEQKQKLLSLLDNSTLGVEDLTEFLRNETVRGLLEKLVPEGAPKDALEIFTSLKDIFGKTSDTLKSGLDKADDKLAAVLDGIHKALKS